MNPLSFACYVLDKSTQDAEMFDIMLNMISGYMSPEYALQGLFSVKSDVFSFGVLLLETLSSKKNIGFYNTDSFNLLGHVSEKASHFSSPLHF